MTPLLAVMALTGDRRGDYKGCDERDKGEQGTPSRTMV